MIEFTVHGIAQPAGSKNARPIWTKQPDGSRRMMTRDDGSPMLTVSDANAKAGAWKQEIKAAAVKAMDGGEPIVGAVLLYVTFIMPRPRDHFRTGKHEGVLKPNAPRFHTKKPDVTKLVRCLEDALTGIVWRDDAQVAETVQLKVYGDQSRVDVQIEELKSERPERRRPVTASLFGGLDEASP